MSKARTDIEMIENDFSDEDMDLTSEQSELLTQIRYHAKEIAYLILENCNANQSGVSAYQALRESVFWTESAMHATNLALKEQT